MASAFATLHHVSGGRAHIGVGRGDTALELVGIKPPSASRFEALLGELQAYLRGDPVDVGGFQSRISWLPVQGKSKVPVDVFGSGPHAIDVAARLGDKTTVAVGAERERIEWAVRTTRGEESRGPKAVVNEIGAPLRGLLLCIARRKLRNARDAPARPGKQHSSNITAQRYRSPSHRYRRLRCGRGGNRSTGARRARLGNSSISAHFQRDVTSSLSHSDATVVEEVTSRYDNYHHGLEHAAQAEVIPADFLSQFCVIGSPDAGSECLCQLIDLGLSHLVIVGGSRDIDATVRERSDHLVAREVLPTGQAIALSGSRPNGDRSEFVAMGKEQFSYRITKNGKIFVYWHRTNGMREIVLKGAGQEAHQRAAWHGARTTATRAGACHGQLQARQRESSRLMQSAKSDPTALPKHSAPQLLIFATTLKC